MPRTPAFTDEAKIFIADSIRNKTFTVTQLANHFGRHPKSINRVMDEMQVTTNRGNKTSIAAGETKRIKKSLATAGVNADQLGQILVILTASHLTNPDHLRKALVDGASAQAMLRIIPRATAAEREQRTAALFRAGAQIQETPADVRV